MEACLAEVNSTTNIMPWNYFLEFFKQGYILVRIIKSNANLQNFFLYMNKLFSTTFKFKAFFFRKINF